ncbi:gamma-glutamylcyclotransferase [Paracraurococcus ruber]|uniref:glutathione-specific gamma-glutamylcyclotransferase n=1 Tax=Paracraurococcus ruber TaxID=77675 RepID=A0ABS1CU39_9PROT|nr:gamma-glutamylcyclotransferase [Paracraurococcus ruber]MBK1658004.1 gamma-glutamylcyclotransferase [Paracraurococcus ruber]TDG33812.1 gamma-glutamylcyclotransferase [Paracraurococcus ruber]
MATPHAPADHALDPDGHLYVFAYGSLIWRPGFAHASAHPALLRGFHRRFCLWSRFYRGSPETPGLVLGLDRGGACRGIAFRVPGAEAAAVLAYLDERENIGGEVVYTRRRLPVRLLDGDRMVMAVAYVVDRRAAQYCRPAAEEAARAIARGIGRAGPNRDYLLNTLAHLQAMGVRDAGLDRIAELLPPQPDAA